MMLEKFHFLSEYVKHGCNCQLYKVQLPNMQCIFFPLLVSSALICNFLLIKLLSVDVWTYIACVSFSLILFNHDRKTVLESLWMTGFDRCSNQAQWNTNRHSKGAIYAFMYRDFARCYKVSIHTYVTSTCVFFLHVLSTALHLTA